MPRTARPTAADLATEVVGRELLEIERCRSGLSGFVRWCRHYCRIQDKVTGKAIPFKLYNCQRETARRLLDGDWLWILKARQLGFTWLLAAFVVWQVTFNRWVDVAVLNQDKSYAQDFIWRVKFIHSRLPRWMRQVMTRDSLWRVDFDDDGHGCSIRAYAATDKSTRSLTGNLVFFDESARIADLQAAKQAAEPAVEVSGGQIVAMSTSAGPTGGFYEGWVENAKNPFSKYENIFYGWRERPGRTQEWYDGEAEAHRDDPLFMKREYPNTPEEAFEFAEGRVFPLFSRDRHVKMIELGPGVQRYRCLDWGAVDPFVCLWVWHDPSAHPRLSVDPGCPNTIRELIAYRRHREGGLIDSDNHCPDALRYLVATGMFGGHVHVYREFYLPDSSGKGYSLLDLAREVAVLSAGEEFVFTVADGSRPDSINMFSQQGIPTCGHYRIPSRGGRRSEIEQGLDRLNALIVGNVPFGQEPDEQMREEELEWALGQKVATRMSERIARKRAQQQKFANAHPILGTEW